MQIYCIAIHFLFFFGPVHWLVMLSDTSGTRVGVSVMALCVWGLHVPNVLSWDFLQFPPTVQKQANW